MPEPMCKHEHFEAHVDVNRVGEGDPPVGDPKGYLAEIKIRCTQCDTPFEFIGADAGLQWDKPATTPDAQTLRAPIRPKGSQILPAIPGFKMFAN